MAIASVNPATGEVLQTFSPLSDEELEARIALAAKRFAWWRTTPFSERRALMLAAAEVLEDGARTYAETITTEMGKPIAAAIAEVRKSAMVCRFYAENAERLLADEEVATNAKKSFIRYQPLGVVLAVMPWNFPFWQVFRFAAPALMAGNVGLLKHASNVPRSAMAIEEIFREAGFERGLFQTLLIGADRVEAVLRDARVAAATLTGSEAAGAQVASVAGSGIKKTVLELGGSDPFIVTPSADLDAAVKIGLKARNVNNGQSCIAAKRFIVFEEVADEFTNRFVDGMKSLKIGDPMDEATDIGPLATPQIVKDLEEQVEDARTAGAKVLTGGARGEGAGNYYLPTVLADVPRSSRAFHEELFGPVAVVHRVKTVEEAIRLANDTPYGLGSSVWTKDDAMRDAFVDGIEAGQVFVNAMVASDPRLPFGGVKQSGYGRELGALGIREFVNIKTVWVE